jgi:hypothetical protein
VVHKELVEAAASRQSVVSDKKALEARMIRVHADKLDQLIDLVGEMVIAGAGANLLAQRSGQSDLMESTSVLLRLVEDIRDSALQLRMVQIGETFNRFNRVVRDNSREMGKAIDLVITGAETELDKSVVEKLGDPLMHLVRNAIDHGIESPKCAPPRQTRKRARSQLNAYHDSGSIVIEVIDDGGGLPRDKIRQKAIDKGLIDAAATLSDHEIINLIFEAGFSTADQVTNLSGRGVGMDVVRRNIQSLRGSVEVDTCRRRRHDLHHPPAADAGDHRRLPDRRRQGVLRRAARLGRRMHRTRRRGQRNYLNLRGEVLPFVRLRELFAIGGEPPAARTWSSSSTPAEGRPGRRCPARRIPDGDQAARRPLQAPARHRRLDHPRHRRSGPDPRRAGQIIGEVKTAADSLNNAAGQVSATAQSLSQSSSEQAASVEETTASIEQMTASITQNTENAKVTDNMATKSSAKPNRAARRSRKPSKP